jgi:hypothetical protein
MSNKLPKLSLGYNKEKAKWQLKEDKTGEVIKNFFTKDSATQGGVLKKILGDDGGSVKIKKTSGEIQEERTYPKEKDPSSSKG